MRTFNVYDRIPPRVMSCGAFIKTFISNCVIAPGGLVELLSICYVDLGGPQRQATRSLPGLSISKIDQTKPHVV